MELIFSLSQKFTSLPFPFAFRAKRARPTATTSKSTIITLRPARIPDLAETL